MIGERKLSILMVSLALAGGVVAVAQEGQDTDRVKLSVNLMGSYTDNRDSSTAEKESTFDFFLQPRIDVLARWAEARDNGSLVFYYAPAYRYRTNPSDFQNSDQLFHDVGLELRHGLAETAKLRFNEYFNYTDDPSVQKYGETLRSDASFILNRVDGGVTYVFSRRSNIDLHAQNMIKRYSDAEVALASDEDATGGGVALWGQVSKSVGLLLLGDMTGYGYDNSEGVERGFTATMGAVGLEGVFSPNFRMGLRAGLENVSYDDPTLDDQSTPYGSATVTVSPIPTTRLTAGVSYSIRNSDVYPFASQESTDFTTDLQWEAVPSKVTVDLAVAFRSGEYTAEARPQGQEAATTGTRDAFYGSAQVTFNITAATALRLGQAYEDVSSDAGMGVDFTKNTTTVSLTQVF